MFCSFMYWTYHCCHDPGLTGLHPGPSSSDLLLASHDRAQGLLHNNDCRLYHIVPSFICKTPPLFSTLLHLLTMKAVSLEYFL